MTGVPVPKGTSASGCGCRTEFDDRPEGSADPRAYFVSCYEHFALHEAAPRMLALLRLLDDRRGLLDGSENGPVFGIHPSCNFQRGYAFLEEARSLIAELDNA